MTGLVLQPTTDTVQGWLVLAILSLVVVCLAAAVPAIWGQVELARAERRREDAEIDEMRQGTLHYRHVVDVAGTPVLVQADRPVAERDMEVLDAVLRLIAERAEELAS